LVAFVKGVGAVCLGSLVLWQVAQHSGATRGTAIVHVFESHVVVSLDDRDYPVNTVYESPLLCEVRAGRHVLKLKRGDRVVYNEEFSVEAGQEVVLTAWDPASDNSSHLPPADARATAPPVGVNLSPDDRR
jgi:hypothetical protein